MTSDKYFTGEIAGKFDFIYIDGDHTSAQVERDAYSAWKLLKDGGILAFDDYLWGQDLPPDTTPKPAIDNFLRTHTGEYTQLVDSHQVWIKKNDN
jgi:predicted O-methyltransferase YrrM